MGTDHVNHRLPLAWIVLHDAFEGEKATLADRCLRRAKLLDCLQVQLGQSPLGRIVLLVSQRTFPVVEVGLG